MRRSVRMLLFLTAVSILVLVYWRFADVGPRLPKWLIDGDTVPDDHPITADQMRIDSAPDFEFAMGQGSGLHGLDVFRVRADGRATYTFHAGSNDPFDWRQATFTLSAAEMTELRQTLIKVGYPALAAQYHARNIADGTQWCVSLTASGMIKKVYCNNNFPWQVRRLSGWVNDEVLPRHKPAIDAAQKFTAYPTSATRPGRPWEEGLWP